MSTDDHSKIQSLSPCNDWFYIEEGASAGKDNIYRVAAWALRTDGQVIGMIAAASAHTEENVPRLVTPPQLGGAYFHRDSLTPDQIKQAADGARLPRWSRAPA